MKTKIFAVRSPGSDLDIVLLLIRLITGYAFILHGWGKIQSPFTWMGPDSAVPALFQGLAALSEFGGGIALVVGLLTRLGALGIAFTMAVAVYMHSVVMGDPFVNLTGGRSFELAAAYFLMTVLLVFAGPGRISLDMLVFGAQEHGHERRGPGSGRMR